MSLPVAGATAALLLLLPTAEGARGLDALIGSATAVQKQVVASLVLLLLRDLGLVLALSLGPRPRRAEMSAAVYLVVLYAIAPGLALQLDWPGLRRLLWPSLGGSSLAALAPLAAVAAVSLGAAWLRWRRARERFPATGA